MNELSQILNPKAAIAKKHSTKKKTSLELLDKTGTCRCVHSSSMLRARIDSHRYMLINIYIAGKAWMKNDTYIIVIPILSKLPALQYCQASIEQI